MQLTFNYKEDKNLDYYDLCKKYQEKYGIPSSSYFLTESCKTKNTKITRGKDGLFLHHIYEYHKDYPDINDLSKPELASKYPFKFQEAKNLCYCNYLEHLLLHIKINELRCKQLGNFVGDGVIHYLIPIINDYIQENVTIYPNWQKTAFQILDTNQEDYLDMLTYYQTFVSEYYSDLPLHKLSQISDIRTLYKLEKLQQKADEIYIQHLSEELKNIEKSANEDDLRCVEALKIYEGCCDKFCSYIESDINKCPFYHLLRCMNS